MGVVRWHVTWNDLQDPATGRVLPLAARGKTKWGGLEAHGPLFCDLTGELVVVLLLLSGVVIVSVFLRGVLGLLLFLFWSSTATT